MNFVVRLLRDSSSLFVPLFYSFFQSSSRHISDKKICYWIGNYPIYHFVMYNNSYLFNIEGSVSAVKHCFYWKHYLGQTSSGKLIICSKSSFFQIFNFVILRQCSKITVFIFKYFSTISKVI